MTALYTRRAPNTSARAEDWRDNALCRRVPDKETFFPVGSALPAIRATEDAKALCSTCPVAMACAQHALTNREAAGVWGRLDESQRTRLLRNINREQLDDRAYLTARIHKEWADAEQIYIDAYLDRTEQEANGHVRWTSPRTSVTIRGRIFTPGQLAFQIGHGRPADGHVKARCSRPHCVAPEHLADSLLRWKLQHLETAA
ncbi:WhiB family transcriptional regulator [Streptomyces sp. NPDC086023]|uniref:WhiB family transcriptional regulator n=1 Tax=Streptomyces sp. NPDC086023 TaxID=3365746 RepID=UPI0037D9632A